MLGERWAKVTNRRQEGLVLVTLDTGLALLHGWISLLSCPEGIQVGLIFSSLLSVEISDASLRPILLNQQRKVPSVVVHMAPNSSAQPTCLGELPFLHIGSRSSSQKRKRSVLY